MKQIGCKIIRLESVDSTNNYVANLVKEHKIDDGTVIMAVEQYDGRGQRGAEWLVKPGENLTFSFFIQNVNLSVEKQFVLTQIVSLSLVNFFLKLGIEAEIKWPNDIFIGKKKIAGVLIENQITGSNLKNSIIGVGINVNQLEFLNLNATSLKNIKGGHFNIDELLFSFISSFNAVTSKYQFDFQNINQAYLNEMYLLGVKSSFRVSGKQIIGEILGVSGTGKLILEQESGIEEYDLKEIQFNL